MTTDETCDQSGNTPEQIITDALYAEEPEIHSGSAVQFMKASRRGRVAAVALRAAGLLIENAPTDEQVEAATWALIESDTDTSDRGVSDEHYRDRRADVERIAPILRAGVASSTPTGEHVERAKIALKEYDRRNRLPGIASSEHRLAEALRPFAAAGVTPPAPSAEWPTVERAARVLDVWLANQYDGDQNAARIPVIHAIGDALAAPPAPSANPEKLIAEELAALTRCSFTSGADHATIHAALTAPAPTSAPSADRERRALNRVWAAMGCAWNPEEFRPSERDSMWKQIIEWCEEQTAGNSRIYRENQQLQSAVLDARAPVDEAKLPTETRDRLRAFLELSLEGRYEYTARVGDREARIGADDLRVLLDILRGEHGISQD